MKPLLLIALILLPTVLLAQSDSINADIELVETPLLIYNPYDQEFELSITGGLYNFYSVDKWRYDLTKYSPSIGLSYEKPFLNALKTQVSAYFTSNKYKLAIDDSTFQTVGEPVRDKGFTYVDVLGSIHYVFQECPGIKAYVFAGGGVGVLIQGRRYIKGIEAPEYVENPTPLFTSTGIFLIGGGMKYYFIPHVGIDLKFVWHQNVTRAVKGEEHNIPNLRLEGGLCYAF